MSILRVWWKILGHLSTVSRSDIAYHLP
jgi:hypothetical protein